MSCSGNKGEEVREVLYMDVENSNVYLAVSEARYELGLHFGVGETT